MRTTLQERQRLVDAAIALDREVAAKRRELSALKEDLIQHAFALETAAVDCADGAGKVVTMDGSDGSICRVTFPGPRLKDKIEADGRLYATLREVCGQRFESLFATEVRYKPVGMFREAARSIMGQDAAKVIKLCQVRSVPTVSFETKEGA